MKTASIKTSTIIARTIKESLAMVTPILFIGSITVLLNGFPVQAYQDFLNAFLGGALRNIILIIQVSTIGILAVYITIACNLSYNRQMADGMRLVFKFGSLMGSLAGFIILVGLFVGEKDLSLLSGQGVFSAMVAGIVGAVLFRRFEKIFKTPKMIMVDGADTEFNAALHVILPFLCVTVCFAVANYLITVCFNVESVQHLFMKFVDAIFLKMHRSYLSGLLFIFLAGIMWCFGIHGNNVLNQVAEDMFTEIIPGQIVSKSFIDTFVNMGGTGCTIGLLVALMVFGRRNSTKKLTGMAFLPGIFNIGEMLVFGFPIIYNPPMAIPFVLAPILCFTNAFVFSKIGFLPPVTKEVIWTTPALMSGFIATGSIRGIIVQILNIIISAACYAPFVINNEKVSLERFTSSVDMLTDKLKKSEATGEKIVLTECDGNVGRTAKLLAVDLEVSLSAKNSDTVLDQEKNPLSVEYKHRYDENGRCISAKAKLLWEHGQYGEIYPPLVLKLARESGDLFRLESFLIESAIRESEALRHRFGEGLVMNVGITDKTLCNKKCIPFLQKMSDRYKLRSGNVHFDIIEGDEELSLSEIEDTKSRIRIFGYTI